MKKVKFLKQTAAALMIAAVALAVCKSAPDSAIIMTTATSGGYLILAGTG